ncbi:MAG: hypothetical protein JXQ23_08975 [Clostridia bacterium]|nr:hypothetical protein [Clostridia bacterium]
MEKKMCYELLEIAEEASQDEIEKAYNKILNRARFDKGIDVVSINKAYETLTGKLKVELSDAEKAKMANAKKRSDKLPYFIVGGIILAIILAIVVPSFFKAKPGLNIVFVGGYNLTDKYVDLETTLEKLEGTKKVSVTSVFLDSTAGSGEADMAGRVTLSAMLQSGEADIIITSLEGYNYMLIDNHALKSITPNLLTQLGLNSDDSRLMMDSSNSIYGIDVGDITLISDCVDGSGENILTISQKTERYDEVIQVIKAILGAQ